VFDLHKETTSKRLDNREEISRRFGANEGSPVRDPKNPQNMKLNAPAGNRTRVCTVAGYYSTTRPLVLCLAWV
ncbi:unnamed protein product, partial [Musa banksii]